MAVPAHSQAKEMTKLKIQPADNSQPTLRYEGHGDIAAALEDCNVRYERWPLAADIDPESGQDEIIEAYRTQIDEIMQEYGFQAVDVVRLSKRPESADEIDEPCGSEHSHIDYECRLLVEGRGCFILHTAQHRYELTAEAGDMLCLPPGLMHSLHLTGPCRMVRLFSRAPHLAEAS